MTLRSHKPKKTVTDTMLCTVTHTMLFTACITGDIDTVKQAIEQQLDLEVPDELGNTPLCIACLNNKTTIANELIDAGVNVDAPLTPDLLTPLMIACAQSLHSTVQKLLEARANLDIIRCNTSALRMACMNNSPQIVKLLLRHGAKVHEPSLSIDSFDVAIIMRRTDIIRVLLPKAASRKIKENLYHIDVKKEIQFMLQTTLEQRYKALVMFLIFGSKDKQSPLSALHKDLFQDIKKVIKEKIFL